MFARHSLCAATRFIEPTTRSPTTRARMSTPGFGMYSWRHTTSPKNFSVSTIDAVSSRLFTRITPIPCVPERIFRMAGYRTRCEEDAPWDRNVRLAQRLQREELVARGDEAVARQRRPDAHQLELAQQHLAEVGHGSANSRDQDVVS